MGVEILPAYGDMAALKALFLEYIEWVGVDLAFQNVEQELDSLPGKYAMPGGRLYLARVDGAAAGCVALRPCGAGGCEMKRLYVRSEFRGHNLGERLAKTVIAAAKEIGYGYILLDSMPFMQNAAKLYEKLGFYDIDAYYENPFEGVRYMRLDL